MQKFCDTCFGHFGFDESGTTLEVMVRCDDLMVYILFWMRVHLYQSGQSINISQNLTKVFQDLFQSWKFEIDPFIVFFVLSASVMKKSMTSAPE